MKRPSATIARELVPVADLDFLGAEMKVMVCRGLFTADLDSLLSFVLSFCQELVRHKD